MPRLLTDEMWRRHANQWSVYTRFLAIPLLILAGWSRVSLGVWAAIPIGLVLVWLVINPYVFRPIDAPRNWIERGILGEKLWLRGEVRDRAHRDVLRVLLFAAGFGLLTMLAGIVSLEPLSAVMGAALLAIAQFWRIRRYARLHDEAATVVGTAALEARAASAPERETEPLTH